jgi:ribonuclease G
MIRYKLRITFIADETISLNEFKATLTGSDLEITDLIVQGQSLEKVLEAQEKELLEIEVEDKNADTLDYYSKNDSNGSSKRGGRKKRPKRPQSQSN